jgi:hypothetical protein
LMKRLATADRTPRSVVVPRQWPAGSAGGGVVEHVRALARAGELAATAAAATDDDRCHLTAAVYQLTWPVVFEQLTRRIEIQRGHPACASSLRQMAADCLDRFEDDVEAVVFYVLKYATVAIADLEAWTCSRLTPATVDAHRRRRGARGALQRPRLPRWLADALGHDRWLAELATEILIWVGVTATAGTCLWPLDSWTSRRAVTTGDWHGTDQATVAEEVEYVLRVMRQRPEWYASYVECPLGRKQPAVHSAPPGDSGRGVEPAPLALVERHEVEDARLRDLAASAVEAIGARIAGGEPAPTVVVDVLTVAFGGSDDLDLLNAAGVDADTALTLLGDPRVVERVAAAVLSIVEEDAH